MMTTGWKRTLYVGLIIAVNIAFDQITKVIARRELSLQPGRSYLGDLFRLVYVENEGAFLSLGSGLAEGPRYWVLTILPILILGGLLAYILLSNKLPRWHIIAYAFILGGGISNIYDRLLYGQVVDFMNMGIGNLRTGIFNFADVSIMTGLFIMLPSLFHKPKSPSPAEE